MLVAVYGRVSTGHIEQESSYENQYNYFKEKIEKEGNELYKFYGDKGISGVSLKNRKQFNEMLYDAGIDIKKVNGQTVYVLSERTPNFNMIYTKSTSRLARTTDIINIINLLKRKNVTIYFDDLNKTTNDIDSELLINILILLDANFSKDLSRKIKFGIKQSDRSKLINQKILGYDLIDDKLVPNKECIIIHKIMNKYSQRQSLNAIAIDINKEFNKSFDASRIKQIVENVDKYSGYLVTNKCNVNNHIRDYKDRKDWIITKDERITPIISEETRQLVLNRLDNKIQMLPRNHNEYYKKIICSECGKYYNYVGSTDSYYCHGKKGYSFNKNCNNVNVKREVIDEFVNDVLVSIETIYETNIYVNKMLLDSVLNTVNTLDIKNELNKLYAQREKLLDLYLDANIDKHIYKQRENDLNTRINELESKIDNEFTNNIKDIQERLDKLNTNIPKTKEELLEVMDIYVYGDVVKGKKLRKPRLEYKLKINQDIQELVKRYLR